MSFLSSVLIGATIGIAITALLWFIALQRKANAKEAKPTKRMIALESREPPQAVFARLKGADLGRFKLGDGDDGKHVLVFQSKPTFFSYGFFFPIFVSTSGGGARLDIGIASRAVQWGPVVSKTHDEFAGAVRKALGIA